VVGSLFGKILEYGTFQAPHSRDAAKKVAKAVLQVSEKLKDKNPEDFVEYVPPELAVPIFSKLSYFDDSDLRELLVSLLAGSMLKETQVHPTVVSTVDKITPGEAKILKRCAKRGNYGPWPSVTIKAASNERTDGFVFPSKGDLSAVQPTEVEKKYTGIFRRKGPTQFKDLGINHIASMESISIFPDEQELIFYVSNLRNIGIIEATAGILSDKKLYLNLIGVAYEFTEQAMTSTGNQPIIEPSKLSLTPLGREVFNAFRSID